MPDNLITKTQAEAALKILVTQLAGWVSDDPDYGPKLYPPGFHADSWVIAWDGGPYEWPMCFPFGGRLEYGGRVENVEQELAGIEVYAEPLNHWSVYLCKP